MFQRDIAQSTRKNGLSTLYNAFVTDIDNVNAELEVNFGHVAFYTCNKASKTE